MAKSNGASRMPRGTKILAKAFFTAADEIPEPQRAEVIKAALAAIRDELKVAREKAVLAKAKAKEKAAKGAKPPAQKPVAVKKAAAKSARKSPDAQPRAAVQQKAPAKRARKTPANVTESAAGDERVEASGQADS